MRNPTEGSNPTETLTIGLPAEMLEAIAQRAAELALQRMGPAVSSSPYMTIPEAADYARCKRQRIDDLLSRRRLTRYKDGSRTLVSRAELDAHLAGELVGPVAALLPGDARARAGSGVRR